MEQGLGAVKLAKARNILRAYNQVSRRDLPWEWVEELMLARLRANANLPCPHGGSNKARALEFVRLLPADLSRCLDEIWKH